jgi:hypothetical protein
MDRSIKTGNIFMGISFFITGFKKLGRAISTSSRLLLALLAFTRTHEARAGIPVLSLPVPNGAQAFLTLTNCDDPNSLYVVQLSTNLLDWIPCRTNSFANNPFQINVPATNSVCYYRVIAIPMPQLPFSRMGLMCRSNIYLNGRTITIDSFDSSDINYSGTVSNVPGQYDITKRKSDGDVGVSAAVIGAINVGNSSIYGRVHTGLGSVESQVQIASGGVVGDFTWAQSNTGIENQGTPSSWWRPDFNVSFPNLAAPLPFGVPIPANGILNGGDYTTTSSTSTTNLTITAPSKVWVQGSASIGVTLSGTNASLRIYVGTTTGTGDTISFSRHGTMNYPGYARNFQIYGLSSVTGVNVAGNQNWNACIYAPNAGFSAGGNNVSGVIAVESITVSGSWNFHFDESLAMNGPIL